MAALLTTQTSDTTGTGASHSGPASVFLTGTLDGAQVTVEASTDDTNYVAIGTASTLDSEEAVSVTLYGTYYLRAKLSRAGSSTSVTVTTTQ